MIQLLIFGFGGGFILAFAFFSIVNAGNNKNTTNSNEALTITEKETLMNYFINENFGYISPETRQKVYKNNYYTDSVLLNELSYMSEFEFVNKYKD